MIYNHNIDFVLNDGVRDFNVRYFRGHQWLWPTWQKSRHCIAGEEEVKFNSRLYLTETPLMRMGGNGQEVWREYVQRASYFNAVGRTVDGMMGMLFRKMPEESERIPALDTNYLWFSNRNESIADFTQRVVLEQIATNLTGILIDFPATTTDGMSVKQVEDRNLLPYATLYPAESIIDVRYKVTIGRAELSTVILHEVVEVDENEFERYDQNRIRVLSLDEDGYYMQRIFGQTPVNEQTLMSMKTLQRDLSYHLETTIYPLINGEKARFIPFIPISHNGIGFEPSKPILNDLCNVNLKLFSNSADFETALHEVGNPTPVFKGLRPNSLTGEVPTPQLGVFAGIQLDDTSTSDARYMQVSGSGMELIAQAMTDKRQEMALLGARILNPEKRVAETAESMEIARSGENSILMTLANNVSAAMAEALYFIALWHGISEEEASTIEYKLNTNYLSRMTAEQAKQWSETWINGGITERELFEILQQGEVIDSKLTFDEHKAEKEAEKPATTPAGVTNEQPI